MNGQLIGLMPLIAGWLDDSVFLRRTEMEDDAWGSSVPDTYNHRAFTTGRRRVPPPQSVPPGHHMHARKVKEEALSRNFPSRQHINHQLFDAIGVWTGASAATAPASG